MEENQLAVSIDPTLVNSWENFGSLTITAWDD